MGVSIQVECTWNGYTFYKIHMLCSRTYRNASVTSANSGRCLLSIKQLLTFAFHGHVALIDSLMEMPFNNYRPSFAQRQVLTKLMRTYITAYKQVDFASDKHTLFRVQLISNIMYLYIGSLLKFSASGIKCLQPLFLSIRGMHSPCHFLHQEQTRSNTIQYNCVEYVL